MDRTPIHDASMTPSLNTIPSSITTTTTNQVSSKSMIYVCGECHKDNELKSTDVIRCKIKIRVFGNLIIVFYSCR
jgi:hypothetical protein